MKTKKRICLYILVNLSAFAVIFLLPFVRQIMRKLPPFVGDCRISGVFHIYCPLCGGTRAVEAMLDLDFIGAMRCNLLAVYLIFMLAIYDVVLLFRIIKKQRLIFWESPVDKVAVIFTVVFAVVFCVGRNYLLFSQGYDTLGELRDYWFE